jgi:hypothetical protein
MKTINKIIAIITIFSIFSCEDILEKNILNSVVEVVYPKNDVEILSNVVNFQWKEVDGAKKYRVQVYSSTSRVVLDSLVTKNSISYPISKGDYNWKVRAENSGYTSSYTNTFNFSVKETTDLTNQQVVLSYPADNFYTNNANIIMTWETFSAADKYSFELLKIANGSSSLANQQSNLTSPAISLTNSILNSDAEYNWKIKAFNTTNTTNTQFSSRKFYLDTVNPNQPTNVSPLNNSLQINNQQISFTWSIPTDSGSVLSPISYIFETANNSTFTSAEATTVTTTNYQKTFTNSGDYYWRVKAKDQAGNVGTYCPSFKFTVN